MMVCVIKRMRFTIAAVVIAVVGVLIYQFWYLRVPEGCKPVLELLDFNRKQSQVIDDLSGPDGSVVASDAELTAYTAWADGLADRAGRVTDPKLARLAVAVATSADDFVGKLKQVSSTPHAPGAPPPPAAYQMYALNDSITADLAELQKACQR